MLFLISIIVNGILMLIVAFIFLIPYIFIKTGIRMLLYKFGFDLFTVEEKITLKIITPEQNPWDLLEKRKDAVVFFDGWEREEDDEVKEEVPNRESGVEIIVESNHLEGHQATVLKITEALSRKYNKAPVKKDDDDIIEAEFKNCK